MSSTSTNLSERELELECTLSKVIEFGKYPKITRIATGVALSALALVGYTNSGLSRPSNNAEATASATSSPSPEAFTSPTPNTSSETSLSSPPLYVPPSPSADPTTEKFLLSIEHDTVTQRLSEIVTRACQLQHEDLQQLEGTPNDAQIVSLAAVYDATYGLYYHNEDQIGEGGQWPASFDPAAWGQCPDDFPPHGG